MIIDIEIYLISIQVNESITLFSDNFKQIITVHNLHTTQVSILMELRNTQIATGRKEGTVVVLEINFLSL